MREAVEEQELIALVHDRATSSLKVATYLFISWAFLTICDLCIRSVEGQAVQTLQQCLQVTLLHLLLDVFVVEWCLKCICLFRVV